MKRKIRIFIVFSILLFLFFVVYDWVQFGSANWIANLIKSVFILAFVRVATWLWDSPHKNKEA
jgi:hypothetical protein